MKKYTMIAVSVLVAFTGCGRGWLPCLHRGSSCFNGSCAVPTGMPVASVGTGCADCGGVATTAGYEGYAGNVIEGGNMHYGTTYPQGEIVHGVPTN